MYNLNRQIEETNTINSKQNKNKASDYLNICLCSLVLAFFFVSMFFTTNGGFSEDEKRDLAKFPKISEMTLKDFFSGKYFSQIDSFYKDNFVGRQGFLALSDSIDNLKGFESDIKITVSSNDTTNSNQNVSNTNNSSANTQDEEDDEDMYTSAEQVGTLLSVGDIVCQAYGFNESASNEYASVIKQFGDTLTNSNVYNVLVPTHVEFALPKKYQKLSTPQKPVLDLITSKLGDNVIPVDAYSVLKKHKREYIYFKSDHHWTQLGAYYAYTAYCEAAGIEPFNLDNFETKKVEGFLGTFYAGSKEQKLADDPDYVEYAPVGEELTATIYRNSALTETLELSPYSNYSTGANSYGVFLHGDNPLTVIKNPEVDNGKKVVVIKESYGNPFAPLLTQNYSEVYVVDIRYFKNNLKNFVNKNQINDVIFINNMVATGSQDRVDELKGLLK